MNIDNATISQGHLPTPNPGGINVIVDVIRAFTTCHVAFLQGVRRILLVATVNEAFELKERISDSLLAGEVDALPISNFDCGNSPFELLNRDLKNTTLILKTTNGVTSTLNAMDAERIFVCGLCNAEAVSKYIYGLAGDDKAIQIVASHPTGDDDLACAKLIKEGLQRELTMQDLDQAAFAVKYSKAARKFLDPNKADYTFEDIKLCYSIPRLQLVIEAREKNGLVVLSETKRYECTSNSAQ